MPCARHPSQKLLNLSVNGDFLSAMDDALRRLRIANRSDFIRTAIAEKLARLGISVEDDVIIAPSRAGKGGRRPPDTAAPESTRYPPISPEILEAGRAGAALALQELAAKERAASSPPSPGVGPTTYYKSPRRRGTAPPSTSPQTAPTPAPAAPK